MPISFRDDMDVEILTLPIGMRLSSDDLSFNGDGYTISGKDGRLWRPSDARRQPITINIEGQVVADGAQELDDKLRSWASLLDRRYVYLSPRDAATKVLCVRQTHLGRSPFAGAAGILANVQIGCVADDPYWVARTRTMHQFDAVASGQTATVVNPGTVEARPQITIYGYAVGAADLVNPQIVNQTTGQTLALTLSLADGEAVRVYPIYDRANADSGTIEAATAIQYVGGIGSPVLYGQAITGGTSVIAAVNEDWLFDGFAFAPGDNVIEFTDDAASGHKASIVFEWRSSWF